MTGSYGIACSIHNYSQDIHRVLLDLTSLRQYPSSSSSHSSSGETLSALYASADCFDHGYSAER
ncbi:hypothetical protein HBI81_240760 [Parastagonospora nodorum]|nr:hypothetical protein HBI06_258120 [Parastagonospora nodorum]KAH4220551.1 hypothetical protein HBI05_256690 [Parastagonospora nodorum]KAH4913435.1 hypothetical protein HBH73_255610 [Parastagonospora nodorum]KAH5046174.1 hypothetical protein HBI73_251200 [Parastagonospora nodorum]KAH5095182.1 hypothetical protein HBH71_256450 [Parastagonospora nodorum]